MREKIKVIEEYIQRISHSFAFHIYSYQRRSCQPRDFSKKSDDTGEGVPPSCPRGRGIFCASDQEFETRSSDIAKSTLTWHRKQDRMLSVTFMPVVGSHEGYINIAQHSGHRLKLFQPSSSDTNKFMDEPLDVLDYSLKPVLFQFLHLSSSSLTSIKPRGGPPKHQI